MKSFKSLWWNCEGFEPRSHFISILNMIVLVNVVLNRTVADGREVKHHVYGKRKFVPRYQVSSLLVVYC